MTKNTYIPRVYLEDTLDGGDLIPLNLKQTHHLCHVLRKKSGDPVIIFNAASGEWNATLIHIKKKEWSVHLITCVRAAPPLSKLGLICAPIKHDRMHFMLEKATELGVSDIAFLQTDHTHVKMPDVAKYADTLIHAAQQCERMDVPVIHTSLTRHDLLTRKHPTFFHSDWNFYTARERFSDTPIPLVPQKRPPCLIVGPEGGWSDVECELFSDGNLFTPLSLSPHILRSETAAIIGLARLGYYSRNTLNL